MYYSKTSNIRRKQITNLNVNSVQLTIEVNINYFMSRSRPNVDTKTLFNLHIN
jgi:hypothetical protein